MSYAEHHESGYLGSRGHTVRTQSMAEYRATHPITPVFPPTSETAAKIVMILLYVLILIGVVYIAIRSSGLVS